MAKYLQFDQKTEAPFAADPVTQRMRYLPWSEPVRQRIAPALAIAIAASGLFANPFTPPAVAAPTVSTITSDVIYPRSFIYQSHVEPIPQPAVVIVPDSITVSVSSPVIYQNKFIYQAYAKPILPPAAPTVTNVDPRSGTTDGGTPVAITGTNFTGATSVKFGAFNAASFVVNNAASISAVTGAQPANFVDVTVTTPVGTSGTGAPDTFTFYDVTPDMWHKPWVDPVRLKPGLSVALHQTLAWSNFTPAVVAPTDIKWSYGWTEPVRQKLGLATNLQQSLAWSNFTPTTVTATFVSAFSGDVIYPRSFIYQSHIEPIQPPAAPTVPTYFNLTQGDTGLIFQKTLIYQVNTDPVGVTAPFIYQPWSEPTRRTGLSVALQQSFAWSNFTPAVVATTDIRWLYQWSEPVRKKPGLAASQQQFWTGQVTPPILPPMAWYEPWTDPVRRIGLAVALQQEPAWSTFTPAVVAPTDIRWSYPWSEPVRTKRGLLAAQQHFWTGQVTPPILPPMAWYEPWIDPVKLKPGLSVALHQNLIWSNFTPAPPAVTDIRWSYGWSEPVRQRLFNTALQQPLAFVALLKNASNIAAPYYPWSEPVRIKQGLRTHLQSFTSLVTPPVPNFIRTINWYQAWSEPVRQKKGIKVQHQSAFVLGTPIIKTQVTLTMSAFEINTDMFLAGLFTRNPAVNANVSIKEIPAIRGAAVSLEET